MWAAPPEDQAGNAGLRRPDNGDLKIVTANLAGGHPGIADRLPGIARRLAEGRRPDMMALQEVVVAPVGQSGAAEEVSWRLGAQMGGSYGTYFKPTHLAYGKTPEGVSVYHAGAKRLGAYVTDLNANLGGLEALFPRSAVTLLLEHEGQRYLMTSLHLEPDRNGMPGSGRAVRERQLRTLFSALAPLHTAGVRASIVAGDFNDDPDSGIFSVAAEYGYRDAFFGEPKQSRASFFGFEGNSPGNAIDHVMVNGAVQVVGRRLIFDRQLSDHAFLEVEIQAP